VELLRAEVELLHEGLDSLTNDVPWKVNLLCDQMEGVQTELEDVQNAVRALAAPAGPPPTQPASPAHLLSTPPADQLPSS
jgi:chaperonin cofactor prefoldin